MDFCKTYIPWFFDEKVLGRGIPRGNVVLVTGDEGVGKTILGMEFLYNACHGERFNNGSTPREDGLFIALDDYIPREDVGTLEDYLKHIGFDIDAAKRYITIERFAPPKAKYERNLFSGKVYGKFLEINPLEINKKIIEKYNKNERIKRIVIDSLPLLNLGREKEKEILRFYQWLKEFSRVKGIVTLVISRMVNGVHYWEVDPFAVDTVIIMRRKKLRDGRIVRTITVTKNRGVNIKPDEYAFEIRDKNIAESYPHKIKDIDGEVKYGIWVHDSCFGTFGLSEASGDGL